MRREVRIVEAKIINGSLHLVIPLSAGVPSKSGKTIVAATSSGFVDVPNTEYRISYNIIKNRK